jgi:hypothetical protein
MSRRTLGGTSSAGSQQSAEKAVTEVYSSGTHQSSLSSQGAELGYSVLETPDSTIDPEIIEKFQASFAFDDKERLFGCSCSSTYWLVERLIMRQTFLVTSSGFSPYSAVSTFHAIIYALNLVGH